MPTCRANSIICTGIHSAVYNFFLFLLNGTAIYKNSFINYDIGVITQAIVFLIKCKKRQKYGIRVKTKESSKFHYEKKNVFIIITKRLSWSIF